MGIILSYALYFFVSLFVYNLTVAKTANPIASVQFAGLLLYPVNFSKYSIQ